MSLPPPTPKQAQTIWLALTGLAVATLVLLVVALIWGLGKVLQILNLIQSRGRYSAADLARELDCSERTVFRYLNVLSLSGVPWRYEKASQCYRLIEGYRFPVLNVSTEELLDQAVATQVAAKHSMKP